MKILFTNSPLNFTHGHTFTQPDWQTLVLPTIAGIAGEEHDLLLVDNNNALFRNKNLVEIATSFNPDVIGFSIIAARDIFSTVNQIKKLRNSFPEKIFIAGGQGATFYKNELLDSGVDVVIRGEAEVTLKEVLDYIDKRNFSFGEIDGVSFKRDDSVIDTKERVKIKSLDSAPMPRFDLMSLRKSKWFPRRYTGSIETSRGCAHGCSFCAVTSFWEKSFRRKSNERIIEEIKILVKQGRSHIYLADDNFGSGRKKHIQLFEEIIRQEIDIKFFAQMRTDTIANNPAMIALAAKAGLYGALIGFDTYEEETFHHISKEGSIQLNVKCSQILRENNIMIFGSHIFGLPNQKKPTDFIKTFMQGRKNSDLFRMPHYSVLPGTPDYEKLVSNELQQKSDEKKFDRKSLCTNFFKG